MKKLKNAQKARPGFNARKMGDLIWYERPWLSLYADNEKPAVFYLYKWAECDTWLDRWLVWKVDMEDLHRFFNIKVSLRTLLRNAEQVWVIDTDEAFDIRDSQLCHGRDLPNRYLPPEESFYNETAYSDFALQFGKRLAACRNRRF